MRTELTTTTTTTTSTIGGGREHQVVDVEEHLVHRVMLQPPARGRRRRGEGGVIGWVSAYSTLQMN